MKILIAALSYILSVAVIGAVTFVLVLLIAGPHAGLLPAWLEPVVLAFGWLVVLIAPVLVTRKIWRRRK